MVDWESATHDQDLGLRIWGVDNLGSEMIAGIVVALCDAKLRLPTLFPAIHRLDDIRLLEFRAWKSSHPIQTRSSFSNFEIAIHRTLTTRSVRDSFSALDGINIESQHLFPPCFVRGRQLQFAAVCHIWCRTNLVEIMYQCD